MTDDEKSGSLASNKCYLEQVTIVQSTVVIRYYKLVGKN